MKKIMSVLMIGFILLSSFSMGSVAFGDSLPDDRVVVLGKDLNQSQRDSMLREFGVSGQVMTVEVTNQEERKYLGEFIDSKQLGTRAISSAYIERLPKGEGLKVETNNITWVTNDMYRNALVTAGVTDANVKISSPVKVSGTAALTGIIKAFETMSGEKIAEVNKVVASEEIAKTATLGNEIGQKEAEDLMGAIKLSVIENGLSSKKEIEKATDQISGDLNIELTEEQKAQIVSLMEKISNIDFNVDSIKDQIGDITSKLDNLINQNEEVKGILQSILAAIKNFFSRIFG